MASVLILFSSFDGQTAQVAERVRAVLACRGHDATVMPLGAADFGRALEGRDAAIVGGAVHNGRHAHALEEAVRTHRGALARRPNAFFSVSLSAARPGKGLAEAARCVEDFAHRTGWQPSATATFGGALRYSRYSPFIRLMMRLIAGMAGRDTDTSRDYEYTDWQAVERFASQFAARLEAVPA